MNDTTMLYLVTTLDRLQGVLFAVLLLCGLALLFLCIKYMVDDDYDPEEKLAGQRKAIRRLATCMAIAGIAIVFVPSKGDVLLILAGSEVLKAARSDTASRLTGKSVELLESMIDEQLSKKKAKP